MSVAFDVVAEGQATSAQSKTVAINIAANNNRVLIVGVGIFNAVATTTLTATHNGVSMTAIGSAVADPSGNVRLYFFGLKNPGTGNLNIVVSMSDITPTTLEVAGWSLYNVDQSVGWNNATSATGTSTTASVAITTNSGDAVIGMRGDNNGTSTPTLTNATSDFEDRAGNGNYGGAHALSAASSITPTWTGIHATAKEWAAIGINIPSDVVALSASPGEPNISTGAISA